jgi:hypothetical protein
MTTDYERGYPYTHEISVVGVVQRQVGCTFGVSVENHGPLSLVPPQIVVISRTPLALGEKVSLRLIPVSRDVMWFLGCSREDSVVELWLVTAVGDVDDTDDLPF